MLELEWVTVGAHRGVELYASTSSQLASALYKHIDEWCSRTSHVIQYLILYSSIPGPRHHLLHVVVLQNCHLGKRSRGCLP